MTYFDRFFSEKNLPYVMFEIEAEDGLHLIDSETVTQMIKDAPANEQGRIQRTLVYLDFVNADINNYLRHLAWCFVQTQAAA